MSSSHGPGSVYDDLLGQRIVFVREPLDAAAASLVVAQLLHLERQDPAGEITMYINCGEGELQAALAVYDTLQAVQPEVRTVCASVAGGGAVLLLAGGAPGKRSALPAARVILKEPHGKIPGRAGEVDVQARALLRLRRQVSEILARHTGRRAEDIERDVERGLVLSADEAKAYGLVDEIKGPTKTGS